MFYVYAIYHLKTNKIYIGQTNDLKTRLQEHNDANCFRHTYTRKIGIGWKIVYSEVLQTRESALVREKQLKSYQGRLFVRKQINNIPL